MRWSKVAVAGAFAALAPCAGCVSVGPDYAAPRVETPPVYQGAPEQGLAARSDWWRIFGVAELDAIIAEAILASPSLAEADASLDAAHAARDAAFGGLLPRADASAGAERTRINAAAFGFDGFPTREISRYTASAGISYDLDLFGGGRRAREAASARFEAEAFRRDAARLTLVADIVSAAIEIAALLEEERVLQAIVEDDQLTLQLVERALRAGAVAEIDRLRARTQLAQDSADLPRLRARIQAAQTELAILMGRAPGLSAGARFALDDFRLSQAPASVPSELLRARPDIRAAEAALHAATADIGVRIANLYPQVRLSGNYAQTSLDPETLFQYSSAGWGLGPSISAPLFNGGALRADVRRAEADARRADARYRATVLRAFGQVMDAYSALAAAESESAMVDETVALAVENLRLSRRAYEVGAGAIPDVLDAQRQANLARRTQVRATASQLLALARLHGSLAQPQNGDEQVTEERDAAALRLREAKLLL
jgi:NodT family efflux transporter outer membrane factor (OMF) lipoprotein